jgi:spermidine/putrescine transport system ATP-binding protein
MNEGAVEHLGTPREIYEYPATAFVAGFIGTSNLLSGTISGVENGQAVIALGPGERLVAKVRNSGAKAGDRLDLSVRPEKIDMSTNEPTTVDSSVLRGTVSEVVYLGTSTNYIVTTSLGADIVVFDQNASSADDIAKRGDKVFLSWNPQHSYAIGDR